MKIQGHRELVSLQHTKIGTQPAVSAPNILKVLTLLEGHKECVQTSCVNKMKTTIDHRSIKGEILWCSMCLTINGQSGIVPAYPILLCKSVIFRVPVVCPTFLVFMFSKVQSVPVTWFLPCETLRNSKYFTKKWSEQKRTSNSSLRALKYLPKV